MKGTQQLSSYAFLKNTIGIFKLLCREVAESPWSAIIQGHVELVLVILGLY